MKFRALVVLATSIVAAISARAFDGKEHSRVSRSAILVAAAACVADASCELNADLLRELPRSVERGAGFTAALFKNGDATGGRTFYAGWIAPMACRVRGAHAMERSGSVKGGLWA